MEELKAEYHASEEQKALQNADAEANRNVGKQKRQRWQRETQRRGGTTQMWQLLSFSGIWDPSFFKKEPVPEKEGEELKQQKAKTRAAVEARAKVKLANLEPRA